MASKKKKVARSSAEIYERRLAALERSYAKVLKAKTPAGKELALKRYKHAQDRSAKTKPNPRRPVKRRVIKAAKKQYLLTTIGSRGEVLSSTTFVATALEARARVNKASQKSRVAKVILDDGK